MVPYLATKKLFTKLSAVFVPEGKEAAGARGTGPLRAGGFHQGQARASRASTGEIGAAWGAPGILWTQACGFPRIP